MLCHSEGYDFTLINYLTNQYQILDQDELKIKEYLKEILKEI